MYEKVSDIHSSGHAYKEELKLLLNLVKPKYFSLVNLIMDREIVRELLQFGLRREIASELHRLLEDPAYRERMLAGYDQVREKLGEKGAHFRIAQSMVRYLKD